MARIRGSKSHKQVTTIGFLNTWYDKATNKRLKWEIMGRFHIGVKERAEALGFHFEPLEFDTSVYSKKRIEQILKTRNIDALVLSILLFGNCNSYLQIIYPGGTWGRLNMELISFYH